MKILHVITSLQTGGAEKLMVDLLPRFQKSGLQVDLCIFDGEHTPFRKEIESAGIKVIDFGVGNHVYNPLNVLRLKKLMKGYDIVHTHNTAPQFFAAIANLLCSVVLCTTEHTTSNRRRGWKWCRPLDRWMYSQYKRVICISEKAEENLRNYLGHSQAKICTINNGVDIAKYRDAIPSPELDEIAPGSMKIIMVAGFRWEKDQDTLIRAMSHLPGKFHLFLVGDGVRRQELEALVKETGVESRVHFMGLRSDVPQLLHGADYIVMSSHFEGLSLSSIEGMCAGKPFIASDVDGLREVVKDYGVVFNHSDEIDFASQVLKLHGDPMFYISIADLCSERAKMFDISNMTEAYYKCYKII